MAIGFKPKAEMTLSLPGCSPSEILLVAAEAARQLGLASGRHDTHRSCILYSHEHEVVGGKSNTLRNKRTDCGHQCLFYHTDNRLGEEQIQS